MDPAFTASSKRPAQIHLFTAEDWEAHQPGGSLGAFAKASAFDGSAGKSVIAPREDGSIGDVLFGLGDGRDGLAVAGLSAKLPAGDYEIARLPEGYAYEWAAAGWLDGAYRFDKYRKSETPVPRLVLRDGEDVAGIALEADAVRLVRDLVNTPAEDMGPDAIQGAISALAEDAGARLETTIGEALLDQNYPMIHAVGRAAAIAPRLMELSWGDPSHPELAIVGKGVAFDTGGLNIKTGDYMRLMKKDMGGAAHAIGLAKLVM
ncbi:MAG: leucyl aminopeptidase family protein, partial [Pseudomonadota bacterium]